MTTHKTIEAARQAAKTVTGARCVIEIEHATEGCCYINALAPMATLAAALKSKPMAEIKRLVAEHPILTAAEAAAQREEALRHVQCERCGKEIDGNKSYSQWEREGKRKVTAYYCHSCHTLLGGMGVGEVTGLQERAAVGTSHEPYTNEE